MTSAVPEHPRRLVYLGTPAMAVAPFVALLDAGFEIPLVVSRPDAKRGRGGASAPSPVKAAAVERGVPVTDRVDDVIDVHPDLGVVVAFGRIIRPSVLERVPMVNLHFSLLPRWRGAAPVERAILAGDERTGVCLMAVDEGLDTGAVYRRAELGIGADESADALRIRLVEAGTRLLVEGLQAGLIDPEPQHGELSYAEKIRPAELELDWSQSSEVIHRVVRLGGAWTTFRGRRLKVWRVVPVTATALSALAPGEIDGLTVGAGLGAVELVEVQSEGKGRQPAAAWRNGAQLRPGDRLGS